jgi:hypothetical protein
MNPFAQHAANMEALPELCYTVTPLGELVIIVREEAGYRPGPEIAGRTPHEYASHQNSQMGVTAEQERAMVAGSMFGWSKALAHPDFYKRRAA